MVEHALLMPEGWLQIFDTVTVTGTQTLDDRKAYTLQLRVEELPVITASIDAETGDLLRYEQCPATRRDFDVGRFDIPMNNGRLPRVQII